jgi:hypothetical protein
LRALPDLQSCMQLCLERDDCSAVTDYLWLSLPELGCELYISSCDAPEMPEWAEEDGGRDYRKICPAGADAGPPPVPSASAAADADGS